MRGRTPAPLPILPAHSCRICGAVYRPPDDSHRMCERCFARMRLFVSRKQARRHPAA